MLSTWGEELVGRGISVFGIVSSVLKTIVGLVFDLLALTTVCTVSSAFTSF